MQGERAIDVGVFERAVFDHQPIARMAFFTRLEAKHERSRDLRATVGERARSGEQDRDVPVVPARVHDASALRAVFAFYELDDR